MKSKQLVLILVMIFSGYNCQSVFGWGKEAHSLINTKAIDFLPEEMNAFKVWKNYIGEHASDPDLRRDSGGDSTEWPKHFIDIDFYAEFLNGNMVEDKTQLVNIYGEETVVKMGVLPWATLETFNNLKKAFAEKNRDKVLIYSADLGHYVADAHQPFHTLLNYNGQLTDQKGIHGRYESEMVNKYIDELRSSINIPSVQLVAEPQHFIFNYIAESNLLSPVILSADKIAFEQAASHGSNDYYRLMWFRTKYVTVDQISKAASDLASLIYSAWVEAGKPNLEELN